MEAEMLSAAKAALAMIPIAVKNEMILFISLKLWVCLGLWSSFFSGNSKDDNPKGPKNEKPPGIFLF